LLIFITISPEKVLTNIFPKNGVTLARICNTRQRPNVRTVNVLEEISQTTCKQQAKERKTRCKTVLPQLITTKIWAAFFQENKTNV
jgi:hypothetical protein